MIGIVKILISIIVIALFSLLQNVLNSKKNKRARQALMPVISGVYCIIAAMLVMNWFDKFNSVAELHEFLMHSNILVANLSIVLGFVIVKLIVRPILTKCWKKNEQIEATSASFYTYDEEYDEWFLMNKWVNFRTFMLSILIGAVIACGGFLGFTWIVGPESKWWIIAVPCAAVVLINEIFGFLNGITKEEYEYSFFGENAHSWKVSKFFKIREIYEKIVPSPILSAHTGCEFANSQSPLEFIEELRESEDKIDQITAEYFTIDDRYKSTNVDGVQATWKLMHRKNVLFFNPFYKDLGMYITLPMINALLSGKKCVVVVGRMSTCEDVKQWISDLLKDYSRMESLWRVEVLSNKTPECEVGILSFPQFYDKKVITANREFFNETDFVLLNEPSIIVNTGQIALNIISQEIHSNDERPVYCICDRKVNGLVDTLSHLLHSEITDVIAAPVPRCIYSGMTWDADGDYIRQKLFDKQTKYLGNGIELAAIAVKNQIPKVSWFSEKKVPMKDVKWIAGQYYSTICRYMNLPTQQKNLYEKIDFISNLWSAAMEKEQFIIVEDEFCNMFGTMRAYLSRGIDQAFVSVLSENYLLRDYMRCNKQMFMTNPDAIPSIVPDYAKTERNTLIKLILMMTYRPVSEAEILSEFQLVGIETTDAFAILSKMLKKYTFADDSIFTVKSVKTEIDELTTITTCCYQISEEAFDEYFADSLKNAFFIIEDEKTEKGYIDSKLFNHVTQIILPGQYVTYEGKYYLAKHISPESGCVLRRAADSYNQRAYYRQLRTYHFEEGSELISTKKVMDIEITTERRAFNVTTSGYLEMSDNKDLRRAKHIDLSNDPKVGTFNRNYKNKAVLTITLPDTDVKQRFTISMLLSEMFRSIFPDAWQYLAVLAVQPDNGEEAMLNKFNYDVDGVFDEEKIYIVEDSDMDLGLLEAIENNLMNFFEIMSDYISWHFEQMKQSASKDPVPEKVEEGPKKYSIDIAEKRKNVFSRVAKRIMDLFTINKKDKEKEPENTSAGDIAKETPVEAPETKSSSDSNEAIPDIVPAPQPDKKAEETGEATNDTKEETDVSEKPESDDSKKEKGSFVKRIKGLFGRKKKAEETEETSDTTSDDNTEGKEPVADVETSSESGEETTANEQPDKAVPEKVVDGTVTVTGKPESDADGNPQEEIIVEKPKYELVENKDAEATENSEGIKVPSDDASTENTNTENEDEEGVIKVAEGSGEEVGVPQEEQIVLHTEGEDLFSIDGVPDDLDLLMPIKASRYQKECFLKFGFEEIDSRLAIEDVNSYLIARGWGNSALKKARKRTEFENTQLDVEVENHCDFCGMPLSGVSYEKLVDGRTRCNDCSMSAINSVSELKTLFNRTETMMEIAFNIGIHVPIAVKTTDARTIAKHSGQVFVPSTQVAARVLGFAQRKNGRYSLFLENGSPRLCAIDTITHELTHIWQYINWDDAQFKALYGMGSPRCSAIASDIVYEGMAMWASIQMLYTMGETFFAQKQEALAMNRTDVYGLGFLMYRERYGMERSGDNPPISPFNSFPPLDPNEVKAIVKSLCTEEDCKC